MGGGGNSLIYNELQASDVNILDDASSASLPLANGIKYVVKAFSIDGKLADWKICEVRKTHTPLKLHADQKYDIVIYSFNNTKDPPRTSNINTGFNYNFAEDTREFLYHKISGYKAIYGKTTLNVTLKHKFSYAKFILDARELVTHNNQDITITNPRLSGIHHNSGTINVNTGAFFGSGNSDIPIILIQKRSGLVGRKTKKLFESGYIPVSLNSGATTGAFIVDISAPAEHGIQKQSKRFPLSIKSGTKNTYTLKPKGTAFVPNPNCDDPNADNYGKPLPCTYYTPKVASITGLEGEKIEVEYVFTGNVNTTCPYRHRRTYDLVTNIPGFDPAHHNISISTNYDINALRINIKTLEKNVVKWELRKHQPCNSGWRKDFQWTKRPLTITTRIHSKETNEELSVYRMVHDNTYTR